MEDSFAIGMLFKQRFTFGYELPAPIGARLD